MCTGDEGCNSDVLSKVHVTGAGDAGGVKAEPQLQAYHVSRATYQIYNRTDGQWPYLNFELPRDQSVLRWAYERVPYLDPASLHLALLPNRTLRLHGRLRQCPGT